MTGTREEKLAEAATEAEALRLELVWTGRIANKYRATFRTRGACFSFPKGGKIPYFDDFCARLKQDEDRAVAWLEQTWPIAGKHLRGECFTEGCSGKHLQRFCPHRLQPPPPKAAAPHSTAAVPHSTVAVPQSTAAVPHSTAAVPQSTAAVPQSTAAVPQSTAAVPHSTAAVPQSTAAVPHSTAAVPHSTAAVPHSTAAVPRTAAGLARSFFFPFSKAGPAAPPVQSSAIAKKRGKQKAKVGRAYVKKKTRKIRGKEWPTEPCAQCTVFSKCKYRGRTITACTTCGREWHRTRSHVKDVAITEPRCTDIGGTCEFSNGSRCPRCLHLPEH